MKTLSILSSEKEVEQKILTYLNSRGYRQVKVDKTKNEISGKRRNAFMLMDKCHFKLKNSGESLTQVDISVNPGKKRVSSKDIELEERLQEKIYQYF